MNKVNHFQNLELCNLKQKLLEVSKRTGNTQMSIGDSLQNVRSAFTAPKLNEQITQKLHMVYDKSKQLFIIFK